LRCCPQQQRCTLMRGECFPRPSFGAGGVLIRPFDGVMERRPHVFRHSHEGGISEWLVPPSGIASKSPKWMLSLRENITCMEAIQSGKEKLLTYPFLACQLLMFFYQDTKIYTNSGRRSIIPYVECLYMRAFIESWKLKDRTCKGWLQAWECCKWCDSPLR
jgi:hypothetical protein